MFGAMVCPLGGITSIGGCSWETFFQPLRGIASSPMVWPQKGSCAKTGEARSDSKSGALEAIFAARRRVPMLTSCEPIAHCGGFEGAVAAGGSAGRAGGNVGANPSSISPHSMKSSTAKRSQV